MKNFRRLGSDRNSVAINKATSPAPTGPVSHPVVGDVTTGSIYTATWHDDPAPDWPNAAASVNVGLRKTVALLASWDGGGRWIRSWSLDGQILTVNLNDNGVEGNYADFWVF